MCIAFFAQGYAGYDLIIAGNRDEFLARKTAILKHHDDGIYSGIDLVRGGMWMALKSNGLFGFVLNFREAIFANYSSSRGMLVRDWLDGKTVNDLLVDKENVGGYNLIVGDSNGMHFVGNRQQESSFALENGVLYGISNGKFNRYCEEDGQAKEWPKVNAGKSLVKEALNSVQSRSELEDSLLTILQNESIYPESDLPINFDQELERLLCPICVDKSRMVSKSVEYGTRTHTVITIKNGVARIVEMDRYCSVFPFDRVDERRVEEFLINNIL